MSQETVAKIIGRAASEPEFMQMLFNDPGAALAGYELSDAELATLRGLTPENFESMSGQLDERVSKFSGAEQAMKMGEG